MTTTFHGVEMRCCVGAGLLIAMLAGAQVACGQAVMDAQAAAKTRFAGAVGVWYGSHFEDSIAHDWDPIREWNGPFHPLLGEYKTDDAKVVKQHLAWLRRAGVDVIFYDVCRIQPELTLLDLPRQKTLKLIAEELAHQEKETRKLSLAIWIERWNSNPSAEEYRFGLEYIRKNLAEHDFYFRLEGKPLVITYLNRPSPEVDAVAKENEKYFALRRISAGKDDGGWRYIGPAGNKECMTANPGVDGFMEHAFIRHVVNKQPLDEKQLKALRAHGQAAIAQRADGKFFEDQMLAARKVDPKVIFISGWNDWAYCLQMEPAKEYGFLYVDMTARLLGREKETEGYRKGEAVGEGK